MIKRGPGPDAASHIGRTDNAMTKIALTKAPTSLLECAVYLSARKKLIHAMSLDTDRPINRAVVVGSAISATRNYLKLHMPRTASRGTTRRSIHQPPALHAPAEMPTALSSVPRYAEIHLVSCSRRAHGREPRRHATLIALVARPGAALPATSCLGAFWTPAS